MNVMEYVGECAPYCIFLLTTDLGWMIPLQYVNAESVFWPCRVPDPSGF